MKVVFPPPRPEACLTTSVLALPVWKLSAGMPPRRTPPAPPVRDARPVNARGIEYQAERLTGNRAQRGNLPGGEPCWVYEVVWKGKWKNSYEPAACLVGWEADMKKADAKLSIAALLPQINPAVEANKTREEAAKRKAEELKEKRARLLRLKARRDRMGNAASDENKKETDYAKKQC